MEYKFIKIGNYKFIFNEYNEDDLIIKGDFDKLINSNLNNDDNYEFIAKLLNNYTHQLIVKITKIKQNTYIINDNNANIINLQNWFKYKELTDNNNSIIQQMRNYVKYPNLKDINKTHKCECCGNILNLEIHHNNIRFTQIAKDFIVKYNIKNINDFKKYKNEFKEYHDNIVNYVILCRFCHENIHRYDYCYPKNINQSNEWIDIINSM